MAERGRLLEQLDDAPLNARVFIASGPRYRDARWTASVLALLAPYKLGSAGLYGADLMGAAWAHGVDRDVWTYTGSATPGPSRDAKMLRAFGAELLVAFPGCRVGLINTALKLGINVLRVKP
ncbi:MAG: hypothetical protein FJ027_24030 [Candidatus Rokubacteria bacterium]|nr:hypothetical protein [Candidatus Rokubacteria bacterium]